MARYPGPYVEQGPDGQHYYVIFGVPKHLIASYEQMFAALDIALRRQPSAAIQIRLLIRDIQTRIDVVAAKTATTGETAVLRRIAATRKRPQTAAGSSQAGRLESGIVCKPLPIIFPRGSGGVGIGQIAALEAATVSGHPTNSDYPFYWRAQEDGSRAMVGRQLYGVFQPGEARPARAEFRVHSTFEQRQRGGAQRSYKMVVRRPVEARNFLKDGAGAAYLARRAGIKGVETYGITRMEAIVAAAPLSALPSARRR